MPMSRATSEQVARETSTLRRRDKLPSGSPGNSS